MYDFEQKIDELNRRDTIKIICFIVGSLLCITLIAMIPHWCRITGEITAKNHVPNWIQHHDAWDEYHHSYTSEWTERDPITHRKHTYTTYHPSYTEHHNAYDEYHPDVYTLFIGEKSLNVDMNTFMNAEKGDWWGADGFYGTKLVKKNKPE